MIWLDPIVRLRLQRGVEHLHDLGPRATAEFLAEVADQIGGMPAIIGMLAEYEQMSPAALRAVGGGSASSSAAALGAAMNRRERRARTAARRREVCSVFEYQVPRGKVALTFDVDGLPRGQLWPPGSLRISPVSSLQHIAELRRGYRKRAIDRRRPDEFAAFQSLGVERHAEPIMPKYSSAGPLGVL